ncbi:MAG: DJ-1 family protein [Chitinivibrionales bacterium]|nr:DJ-1 family protein [Chitinivibrionales bacterium]
MPKHAIVILADGCEEVEAVTQTDLLRRAAITVTVLGLSDMTVTGSHNIVMRADALLDSFSGAFDAIILPGGIPGADYLADSQRVLALVKDAFEQEKLCAAICAAPQVLGKAGILAGKKATCYPGFEDALTGATLLQESVVRDGNVITSRGVGTAIAFALELIDYLTDAATCRKIASALLAS